MLTKRKCTLSRDELCKIVEWALGSAFQHEGSIEISRDLYWRPLDYGSMFDMDDPPTMDCVGSVCDEIDLLRKSIVQGDTFDLPDIVLERLAFILLAIGAQAKDHGMRESGD